jgi:hypothetical protein
MDETGIPQPFVGLMRMHAKRKKKAKPTNHIPIFIVPPPLETKPTLKYHTTDTVDRGIFLFPTVQTNISFLSQECYIFEVCGHAVIISQSATRSRPLQRCVITTSPTPRPTRTNHHKLLPKSINK